MIDIGATQKAQRVAIASSKINHTAN